MVAVDCLLPARLLPALLLWFRAGVPPGSVGDVPVVQVVSMKTWNYVQSTGAVSVRKLFMYFVSPIWEMSISMKQMMTIAVVVEKLPKIYLVGPSAVFHVRLYLLDHSIFV